MITLPSTVTIKPGQYARFDALGRFLRVEERPTHGLGFVYRCQPDGTLERVSGL